MQDKKIKTKEERIAETYIKELISKTQYAEMLKRIRAEKQ